VKSGTQTAQPYVVPADPSDRETVERLVQLYLYDMAADNPFAIQDDGTYQYDLLDQFWRHPYLIRVASELAGFALVINGCPISGRNPCWFMAEFFVLRPFRRCSVGTGAFQALLDRHKGDWHIASKTTNIAAGQFWSRATDAYQTEFAAQFDGADWTVRSFVSK
jgi:predicted acetyltransferase